MGLVQSTTASTAGGTLSITLNGVNPNNVLVLLLSSNVTFTGGLAGWTAANAPAIFGTPAVNSLIYFLQSPAAGTNTVTLTPVTFGAACLMEWSGFMASPLDVAPAASNITAGSTAGSNNIPSGSLIQPQEVIFALITTGTSGAGNASVGITDPPAGFTSLFVNQNSSANNVWEMGYQIVDSAASVTPSWTWTDTTTITSQATLASFKLAPISAPIVRAGYGPGRSPTTARFKQFRLSTFVPPPVAPSFCAEDGWIYDDDPDSEDWIIDQADCAPVGPNQPPLQTQDEPHYWWEDEYEDPIVETVEWSGPIQPNAPPMPVDDAFDWQPEDHTDEPPDDDGWIVRNPNQPPLPAEDIQGHDLDDVGDDWEWWVTDSAVVVDNQAALPVEDAWTHEDDHTDDWDVSDSAPVGSNQPAPPVEDGWDWSAPEDYSDEPPDDDGFSVRNPNQPPLPPEDPWDWSEDVGDDDFTDDGSNVQISNAVIVSMAFDDASWDWAEDTGDDDLTDDGSNVQNANAVTTARFTYLPLLGVS